jgi:hypothetical protein
MSLGTGFFLGCVYLGTVFLYTQTRKEWNWARILQRISLIVLIVISISTLAGASYWAHEWWKQRPRIIMQMGNVAVGERLSDVNFRLGTFHRIERHTNVVYKDDDEERYWNETQPVSLTIRDGRVLRIVFSCLPQHEPVGLNGVRCGDLGEKILERFRNTRVMCEKVPSEERPRRVYDVVDLGTRYVLEANRVVGFLVAAPQELETLVGFNWDACR